MRYLSGLVALAALGGCILHEPVPAGRPPDPPLAREELLSLVRAGVSSPLVFDLVDRRGAEPLDADSLAALKTAGASDALLQKAILAEKRAPVVVVDPAAYYYPGYYAYPPYYYGYAPYYPRYGYAGWGWGYGWGYGWGGYYGGCGRSVHAVRVYR